MALSPQTRLQQFSSATATTDEGLRKYMLRVYNLMALGVGFTGVVSFSVSSSFTLVQIVASGPMFFVLLIAIMGLGWFAPRLIFSGESTKAQLIFWLYAGLWGLWIAPLALAYTGESIARAFFITAASFAGTSLYGYTTKRDLSPWGRFLFMAVLGSIIAVLINAFILKSAGFQLVLSLFVVLIFSAMTAYETQQIKNSYAAQDSGELAEKKAIFGAFLLYGSFVALFVWILSLVGTLKGE